MPSDYRIVIVSSDCETQRRVLGTLNRFGLEALGATTLTECREPLAEDVPVLVFCDRSFYGGGYRDVLASANRLSNGNALVVLMSSFVEPEEYHEAKRAGLFAIITSPCRPNDLEWMVIVAKREERMRTKPLINASGNVRQKMAY